MGGRRKCTCGESYERFRTGLTFAAVKQLMYVGGDDPTQWRHKGRRQVLGYWTELKRQLWDEAHQACPETFDAVIGGDVIPFASQAGARAYARTRAREEGRPVTVEIRAGESVIEAWAGDWRGRVRRAA